MMTAMRPTLFITGGTGFLGKELLKLYLAEPIDIFLLTQEKFLPGIEAFLKERQPVASVRLLSGDITRADLGLGHGDLEEVREKTMIALHLAAAYHLALDRKTGKLVNVEGTRRVVDLLSSCRHLDRFGYLSTTAISGTHAGLFSENDFDVGQRFKNFYEETKFEAEKIVREAMGQIPTTIFRPTIIVGNSRTGEMEKIDGPYYAIRMISRKLHVILQRAPEVKCHIEPVDFVATAIHAIMNNRRAIGKTVHIADPNPLSYDEFLNLLIEEMETFRPLLRVPPRLMAPLFRIPGFSKITGVPRQSFAYTMVPVEYGTETMIRLLEPTGIRCPPASSYIGNLVRYFGNEFRKKVS